MLYCVLNCVYGLILCMQLFVFTCNSSFLNNNAVRNGILFTQECKCHFIVRIVGAFSIYFGYAHYTLASRLLNLDARSGHLLIYL